MSAPFPIEVIVAPAQVPFPSGIAVVMQNQGKKVVLDWDDFQYALETLLARARLNSAMAEDDTMRGTGRNALETLRKALDLGPQDPLPFKVRVPELEGGRD